RPPSHCPACEARLGPFDMVPVVSWVALRARCRHCGVHIPARYPLVEMAAAGSFAAVAAALGTLSPLPSLIAVTGCALAAAAIDWDGSVVPAPLAIASARAAVSLVFVALADGHPVRLGWAGLGAVVAGLSVALAERSSGHRRDGMWQRAMVVAALGWSAGWLWPGGGPLVAAWAVIVTAASPAGRSRRTPLAVAAAGGWCVLVVGAALLRG
ncbi:MAG: prepilin peptidase, partial [Solirubrobacteraceae bacterium]